MGEFEKWADSILKGRAYPAGTRRWHGDVMKEKQADGSWVPVKEGKPASAKGGPKFISRPGGGRKFIRSNKRMTRDQIANRMNAHKDLKLKHSGDNATEASAKWAKHHSDMFDYYHRASLQQRKQPTLYRPPDRPRGAGKDKFDPRGAANHPVRHKTTGGDPHYRPPTRKKKRKSKPAADKAAPKVSRSNKRVPGVPVGRPPDRTPTWADRHRY